MNAFSPDDDDDDVVDVYIEMMLFYSHFCAHIRLNETGERQK